MTLPSPYSFYDADQDPEDLEELLDAEKRGGRYYSVTDDRGELVGFFYFGVEDEAGLREVTLGLGMRPDLTGRGKIRRFLQAGFNFARRAFSPDAFRLSVATFNRRAIRAYEGAGFVPRRTYSH